VGGTLRWGLFLARTSFFIIGWERQTSPHQRKVIDFMRHFFIEGT
jgi:hypothetical protein